MKISTLLKDKLRLSKNVVALTGAGISAESGVPTFRGEDGLWKKFRPEELANIEAFLRNPKLVWEWYTYRRELIQNVKPNSGHLALVKMEDYYPTFNLITQNVDNLHQRSGNKNIIEIHGNIMRNRCNRCNKYFTELPEINQGVGIPVCGCGGNIRPDVVWFGEMLPEDALSRSYEALKNCELLFSIGTSGLVYPAASFPSYAKMNGAYVIEVNVDRTIISHEMDEVLLGPSGKILPELLNYI